MCIIDVQLTNLQKPPITKKCFLFKIMPQIIKAVLKAERCLNGIGKVCLEKRASFICLCMAKITNSINKSATSGLNK